MTTLPLTCLPRSLHAYRRHLGGSVAAVLFLAVLAWLVPVSIPADTGAIADRPLGDAPQNLPPKDLTAFLDVKRWGISLRDLNARMAEEERQSLEARSGLNPALKALGYVGLVVEADSNTVLLTTTEGTVARLEPGDALPDGRVLADVQGNSITLRAADGGEVEMLELFPRPAPRAED